MADTRRELSALQTLFADNTSGDISAQDGRDGWQSSHPSQEHQTAADASLPSSPLTGDIFLPNNGIYLRRYSGSAWIPWGPIFPFTEPVDGDFAWINQGGASIVTTNGGIYLSTPAATPVQLRIRKKAAPATPYTITACFLGAVPAASGALYGILFRQSSDGKCHVFDQAGTSLVLASEKFTSDTSFSADYATSAFTGGGPVWMRIADNGTNRICSWSKDGQHFETFHSIGRTDFLTADEVGFCVGASVTYPSAVTLLSWVQA